MSSTGKEKSLEKEGQGKKKQIKTNNAAFGNTSQLTDEYKTCPDHIWGDVIRHEKVLEKQWKETWIRKCEVVLDDEIDQLMSARKNRKKIGERELFTPFYHGKPPVNIPVKASEMIGWRVTEPENHMDFFKTKYLPDKKRFIGEQYGLYRFAKYVRDEEMKKTSNDHQQNNSFVGELPVKVVRHSLKRIIC